LVGVKVAALGNQFEGANVPPLKPLWTQGIGLVPQPLIVIGAVQVEHDLLVLPDE
jgi:hypothetical protein